MAGRSFFRFHRVCAPPCAKKIQSVFRGGVYAAKNTLRGASVAGRHSQPRRRAKRNPYSYGVTKNFVLCYAI